MGSHTITAGNGNESSKSSVVERDDSAARFVSPPSLVVWRGSSCYKLRISELGARVNRKEIEQRIWGKSIASARTSGLISEQEAQFLIEEYLRDFRSKNGWDGKTYIAPRSLLA